jgi:hypothetical protein
MEEYFKTIVTECLGCGHIDKSDHCARYREPGLQWSSFRKCVMRTHNKSAQVASEKPINPIKASKRSMGVGGIK